MRKFLTAAAIAVAVPTAIAGTADARTSHPRPKVVTVSESYVRSGGRVNVRRGQRLDLVMSMIDASPAEIAAAKARCADYGGSTELIAYRPAKWNGWQWRFVCEGVDF
jgi:hypothetical protein